MPSPSSEVKAAGPPAHGYRGDHPPGTDPAHPRGLTVAVTREAGARGSMVARKLGELLGWQVFDQEMLDYLLGDESGRAQLLTDAPAGARQWAAAELARLVHDRRVSDTPETTALAQLVLTVAARGDAVVIGRGAGFILPRASTLHVRVVAPVTARVNYLAQSLRLTREEAEAEVRDRDHRRANFLHRALHLTSADPTAYDLVVNPARLGVEGAAQVVSWAVRIKQQFAEINEPTGQSGVGD